MEMLKQMVKGGWSRHATIDSDENEYRLRYANADILRMTKSKPLQNVMRSQYLKYIAHVCRCPNSMMTKKMLFAIPKRSHLFM